MQIRGLTPAALLAALGLLLGVSSTLAQTPGQSEGAGSSEARAADELDEELEPTAGIEEFEEPEGESYRPPAGMEERVIMAGESEAAGDLSAGDSITGFDASDLEALGALSVADLGKFTPNLEIVTAGATSPTFFIRGVGLNDFNSNAAGAVAIYQDDVALNSPALQLGTLFDMERVNVLRGPVGSGPYRNASAGAIKLYGRKPTGDYNGYLRASFGQYASKDFEGALEAPIYEDFLSARIAFRVSKRDGYVRNGCGDAPPVEERTVREVGAGTPNDPRWSICGENVDEVNPFFGRSGKSDVPVGLPIMGNDLGNWAMRGIFRFQPTLDMDFLLNLHGAQRDQYSTQGISYGTRDQQTRPDGTTIQGRLGSQDGNSGNSRYRRPSVVDMETRLRLIFEDAICPPESRPCEKATLRPGRTNAEFLTAEHLARNLDNDPWSGDFNGVGKTTNDTWGANIKGEIALPKDMTFRTVTAYDSYDRLIDADTDQSPNPLFEIKTTDQGWQFFQDLELQGAFREDGTLDWDVGGFFLMEELNVRVDNNFGDATAFLTAEREYVQELTSFAVYASLSWRFLDDFSLDGGFRYNWEDKRIDYALLRANQPLTDVRKEVRSAPTGDVRLTYNFREDTHAYVKYTRGWKGGHYNATGSLRKGVTYAEPEQNDAFETGLRGAWFDSRVGFDASFFYYDYTNYQLFTVEQDFGSLPEFVVINASDVEVYGAEVDVSGRPWDGAFANLRFGWLESTFTDFVQTQTIQEDLGSGNITRQVELNFTGNRLLNSPQFKISLTGEQTVPLGRYGSVTFRYDGAWTDIVYFDATEGRGLPNQDGVFFLPEDTIAQRPYWIHNALLIYRPPISNLEIQAFVRNFTNQAYKSFAFDASGFQNTTIQFIGEPRMWGMTLQLNF
jgi:outer membrane receptor protein involved in Fe transport